jgi:hypothetical protein
MTHRRIRPLCRDTRGTNTVEFAIVALPFVYVVLVIVQMGLYYMTQAALDDGVLAEANNLRNSFNTGTGPVLPSGSSLNSAIGGAGGGCSATTAGWKGTLMVVNTIGHLAEVAWHHPDMSLAFSKVQMIRLATHSASRTAASGSVAKSGRGREGGGVAE